MSTQVQTPDARTIGITTPLPQPSELHRPNTPLRRQRLLRGWSLERVAELLNELAIEQTGQNVGVNAQMVGKWERGEKRPRPRYQELLCQLYQVDTDDLGFLPTYDLNNLRYYRKLQLWTQ